MSIPNPTHISIKPTPVIKFISWIYLLLGMESFFWAIFRFVYEGRYGHLTRFGLNCVLAVAFIGLAIKLSKPLQLRTEEAARDVRKNPARIAWSVALLCFALQYYRYVIWSADHVNNIGITDVVGLYLKTIHMYPTWVAMMASLILSQEYRKLISSRAGSTQILQWEMTSGTSRKRGWFKKSVYLELNSAQLIVRTNLFWMRRIALADIIEVRDVPMFLYPPRGIGVKFKCGKRELWINFISSDFGAWFDAFEQLDITVKDESNLRVQTFYLYRWWRFYTVAKAFVRVFIGVTFVMTTFFGILGPILFKDYEHMSERYDRLPTSKVQEFRNMTPGYKKSLRIRSITVGTEKVILTVDPSLRTFSRDTPAYFNHMFRDGQVTLYTNMDYTTIRFRSDNRLTESSLMAKAGFLYAFPIAKDKNGSFRYRFVYLVKIDSGELYLSSLETTYHKPTRGASWNNQLFYRIDEDI